GEEVIALPSMQRSTVREIVTYDGNLEEAFAPQSITLTLNDEIDISRGDMIVKPDQMPKKEREFSANVCWIGDEPLSVRKKYWIKQTSNLGKVMVSGIEFKTDIHTLDRVPADELAMNEIGRVTFRLQKPMFFDSYAENRATGSFILIDTFSNNTVGAGMIV
ncbi:MAG: sulfate adenylyltransferase, partial [Zetaproteobacteria bacterium]